MKAIWIFLFCITAMFPALGQGYDEGPIDSSLVVAPEFPGGPEALAYYLGENIRYPKQAKRKKIEGVVIVSFIVETNGELSRIAVEQSIGYGCNEEAMRVIQSMPLWKPGTANGKPERFIIRQPIRFALWEKNKGD